MPHVISQADAHRRTVRDYRRGRCVEGRVHIRQPLGRDERSMVTSRIELLRRRRGCGTERLRADDCCSGLGRQRPRIRVGAMRRLVDIPGWQMLEPGMAAQAVEVSAYPDWYANLEPVAEAILVALIRSSIVVESSQSPSSTRSAASDSPRTTPTCTSRACTFLRATAWSPASKSATLVPRASRPASTCTSRSIRAVRASLRSTRWTGSQPMALPT